MKRKVGVEREESRGSNGGEEKVGRRERGK